MENDVPIIQTMRQMEWERVKGSLNAILASYWTISTDEAREFEAIVKSFIENFEEEARLC